MSPGSLEASTATVAALPGILAGSRSRVELWDRLLRASGARAVAEVGVFRGEFAAQLLDGNPGIERYVMIDPWRRLSQWNKPMNARTDDFDAVFRDAMERTAHHADRRMVLRGTTSEVSGRLADDSLDVAYVDGDHTLRGITIDLLRMWPKVKSGGWIGGDDFCPSIWQHPGCFEPTLVFPFAVHFAEAMDVPIHALPFNQFLIHKCSAPGFAFHDWTGRYPDTALLEQIRKPATMADGPGRA